MRKIYQFDGVNHGLLSLGESKEPEQIIICITDQNGGETQVILSRDSFHEMCGLSYDIRWVLPKREREPCLLTQAQAEEMEKDEAPF